MGRNITDVIDAIMEHVPEGHAMIAELEWVKNDAHWKAPEQMRDCWYSLTCTVNGYIRSEPDRLLDWERSVVEALMGCTIEEAPHGK